RSQVYANPATLTLPSPRGRGWIFPRPAFVHTFIRPPLQLLGFSFSESIHFFDTGAMRRSSSAQLKMKQENRRPARPLKPCLQHVHGKAVDVGASGCVLPISNLTMSR